MKKHDEGYVLAYVTVVLLLFCLIATMILTGAMKNMTNQQNTIQQMKDRYAAEGMIQQVIAQGTTETDGPVEDEQGNVVGFLKVLNDNGKRNVTAQYGTVVITCVILNDGSYESFEIGVPATEPTGEGEVS